MGFREATHPNSRVTSWGKGSLWTISATAMSCTGGTRHGATNYCPNIGFMQLHPKNKHLQWQHGSRKDRGIVKQWSHEVQCIKDHYPELVVRESIMRSLKGAVEDTAHYMGPTAGVSEILEKLSVIFGTIASFDVLMQNFYKITQGGNKKVPSFATRLEGTLNQIRIKCPGRIADHEVPWHLKE